VSKTPTQIKSLARGHTETAINVLAGIMNQSDAPHSARVSAATSLLDRGWGKPAQAIVGDDEYDPISVREIITGVPRATDA
jgi:hypothetical protein